MNTNTRLSDDPDSKPTNVVWRLRDDPNQVVGVESYSSGGLTRRFDLITPNSAHSRKAKGRHSKWKSFQHYKMVLESPSVVPVTERLVISSKQDRIPCYAVMDIASFLDPVYIFGAPYSPYIYGTSSMVSLDDSLGEYIAPPDNLDELIVFSLRKMMPTVKAQLSVVNSLIELKDFVTLKQTISRIRDVVVSLFKGSPLSLKKRFGVAPLQRSDFSLRKVLQASADSYLQVKFNFQPLFSDIAGVYRTITTAGKRIDALMSGEGRVSRSHFAYNWQEVQDEQEPYVLLAHILPAQLNAESEFEGYWTHVEASRQIVNSQASFHAEMRYIAIWTPFQRELAHSLATLDSLGAQLNPAIIWNALPWSFVVDWFANVSRYLDGFKTENMQPRINVLDYLWSVKRERVHLITNSLVCNTGGAIVPKEQYCPRYKIRETAYRRVVGLPDASSFVTSGLSLTEFSLAAALVFSRSPRRKKRRKKLKSLPRFTIKHAK